MHIVVVILALVGLCECSTTGCGNSPMDVVFLLDSSEDIPDGLFDEEKQLTSKIIGDMWDGQNKIGLVTFGSNPQTQFKLNTYTSISDIQLALQYLWQSTGHADVGKALQYSVLHGFGSTNGGRVLAPDVLILITASDVRNEALVYSIANSLQNSKIELFVVLVGHVSRFWFEKLTVPGNIQKVNDVSAVGSISNTLKSSVCLGRGILTSWSDWSQCGALCDYGHRRRFRSCEKRNINDQDCYGELIDEEDCIIKLCTDPVDGLWSVWGEWSSCSKTCQTGQRTRQRTCSAPFPENGGKTCPGENKQTQPCSDWSCPDCNRQCPSGSHLSDECDVCLCSGVVLFGKIQSEVGVPIADVNIYLKSKMYSPLTTTDIDGTFIVEGICIINETVTVKRHSYTSAVITPTMVNSSHWEMNANLSSLDVPIFILHPEDKTRLVGQSVAFCCFAVGYPSPTYYKWFKETDPIGRGGENGTLVLDSVTIADTGHYHCLTETEAGAKISNTATLIVTEGLFDSCSNPTPLLEELPEGCYVSGDRTKNSTIDVGSCGRETCSSRDLKDNLTCTEWWPNQCCVSDNIEAVEINCEDFSYHISRVTSCKCQLCFEETLITGKAFGRFENGSIAPLQLGTVDIDGKEVAITNMAGVFTAKIPKQKQKLVINFQDRIFKRFLDSTKVVFVTQGASTSIAIPLSFRPKPIEFTTDTGLDIEVGNSGDLVSPGHISIEKDSLVSLDGQPFKGKAKANIHYMDPRNLNDFEAANGEFSTDDGGQSCPLETYGVFTTSFEDENGNRLLTNKPLKFEMDPSVFNITSNELGKPNVELWSLNENTGTWITAGITDYQVTTSRRRLLSKTIVSTVSPPASIPKIDHWEPTYNTKTSVSYVTMYKTELYKNYYRGFWGELKYNWDRRTVSYPAPVYSTVTVKGPDRVKNGACFVSVKVYTVLFGHEPAEEGVQIKAITKNKGDDKFVGYDVKPTNKDGHVCLKIFCDSVVYLSSGGTDPLITFPRHDVPQNYIVQNVNNGTMVEFESKNFENVDEGGRKGHSPVYYFEDHSRCNSGNENDFKFQFGKSIFKPTHLKTRIAPDIHDHMLSWYPTPPESKTRTHCFIKVGLRTRYILDHIDVRLFAISYQGSHNGPDYGYVNISPIPETPERAACIEFRCPGAVNNIRNVDTFLEVRMVPVPQPVCRLTYIADGLNVTEIKGNQGFLFHANSGSSYGPKYGVYIHSLSRDIVERYCFQGKDSGTIDVDMKPTENVAVVLDCT